MAWTSKDPDDVLDYQIDWSAELGTDTISTSTWTVPAGLTKDSDTNTDTTTTVWVSGGTAGTTYALLNKIVTAAGRTYEQAREIAVVDAEAGLPTGVTTTVGGSSSDSYVTEAEYAEYAGKLGWSVPNDVAVNLRRAAQSIDRNFEWPGIRQYETQTMAWPRVTSVYVDGWLIDTDVVPQAVKDAQCELAHLIDVDGLDPFDTLDATGNVKSTEAKAGPVATKTEYFDPARSSPRVVAIEGLLRPYIVGSAGVGGTITLERG